MSYPWLVNENILNIWSCHKFDSPLRFGKGMGGGRDGLIRSPKSTYMTTPNMSVLEKYSEFGFV